MYLQILGIIDQPVLRERWIGINGRRTTLNGEEVATRNCAKLAQAYLYVLISISSFFSNVKGYAEE